MIDIPKYPKPGEDPVKRSMAKNDACAKPATLGNTKVRVRVTSGDKSLKRKRRKHDPRDVHFF